MPGRKRKRRELQEDDAASSDSPLTKALRACRDDGDTTAPAAAGEDGQDLADSGQKRNWRKSRRSNAQREARVGRDTLHTIQASLGRVPKRFRASWRKKRRKAPAASRKLRAGSYTTKLLIEMALPETAVGDNALRREPLLQSASKQAGNSGVGTRTIVRARALAVNALADATEQRLSSLAASCGDGPRAWKVSWDETALRFYCPLTTLKSPINNVHVEPRRVV